jgi:hypothetical protein
MVEMIDIPLGEASNHNGQRHMPLALAPETMAIVNV